MQTNIQYSMEIIEESVKTYVNKNRDKLGSDLVDDINSVSLKGIYRSKKYSDRDIEWINYRALLVEEELDFMCMYSTITAYLEYRNEIVNRGVNNE